MRNKDNFIFIFYLCFAGVNSRDEIVISTPQPDWGQIFLSAQKRKHYLEFIYRFQLILMPQLPVYLWWRFSRPSTLYPGVQPHSGQLFASFVAGIVAIRIHIRIAFSQNTSVFARPEILCETGRTMLTPGECFPFSGVTVSYHS